MGFDRPFHDQASVLASSIGSPRNGVSRLLTVDTTVRSVVLSGGALYPCAWRLYGSTTQVYWTTRSADDATGTLSEDVLAPTTDGSGGTLLLGASSAGSPGAGEADGSTEGGLYLPTDDTQCVTIPVAPGRHAVLYVRCASGSTTVRLEGPFE